jgi:transposase
MKFIQGVTRHQNLLFPESLDSAIYQDNEVRIIDLIVDSLEIDKFGFKIDFKEEGRPAYHSADLLKA